VDEKNSYNTNKNTSTTNNLTIYFRQRLEIVKGYFVAQNESIISKEKSSHGQTPYSNAKLDQKQQDAKGHKFGRSRSSISSTAQNMRTAVDQDPTRGLARLGSRAALSFAFKFLKRAWRSGEDADLCSDILYESLDALQVSY